MQDQNTQKYRFGSWVLLGLALFIVADASGTIRGTMDRDPGYVSADNLGDDDGPGTLRRIASKGNGNVAPEASGGGSDAPAVTATPTWPDIPLDLQVVPAPPVMVGANVVSTGGTNWMNVVVHVAQDGNPVAGLDAAAFAIDHHVGAYGCQLVLADVDEEATPGTYKLRLDYCSAWVYGTFVATIQVSARGQTSTSLFSFEIAYHPVPAS